MQASSPELTKILEASTFRVMPGVYKYVKAKVRPSSGDHFAIVEDRDEITVVTKQPEKVEAFETNPSDYVLVETGVSVPFYSVGYLAAIGQAIAARQMNLLFISTFSKDYFLVLKSKTEEAVEVLKELGLKAKE